MKGNDFKKIRESLGLTQKEMCVLFKVKSPMLISQWESDYRNPSMLVKHIYKTLKNKNKNKKVLRYLLNGEI